MKRGQDNIFLEVMRMKQIVVYFTDWEIQRISRRAVKEYQYEEDWIHDRIQEILEAED